MKKTTMIDVYDLRLSRGITDILKGVHLHLSPGEIYGLLGPNGAGKTTTISALIGLLPYEIGKVQIFGQDPATHSRIIRSQIGILPENNGFYDWMTGGEYLKWYARLFKLCLNEQMILDLLERVGLNDKANQFISKYSRGMKQRLGIARALLSDPKLLVLDEPTNGLDPAGQEEIHSLLQEFVATGEKSVLLCTHLLDDVGRLCNRIGIISNGRTLFDGTTEQFSSSAKQRIFSLRLAVEPEMSNLPEGVQFIDAKGDCYRFAVGQMTEIQLSQVWREFWLKGWYVVEIAEERENLAALYQDALQESDAFASDRPEQQSRSGYQERRVAMSSKI